MSNISVLSDQYKQLVTTSDNVNNSVVAFKKHALISNQASKNLYPNLSVSNEELQNAKVILLHFFENVRHLLKGDFTGSEFIPSTVLDDYKERLQSSAFIQEELDTLINRLQNDDALTGEDLKVFDTLLSILDNERNILFRKLRTARG